MFRDPRPHRLTAGAAIGLAAIATASSVLLPLSRAALLPSLWEVAVPLAMICAAVVGYIADRGRTALLLAFGAIVWCLTGLAAYLPEWGEAAASRLALLPLALLVVALVMTPDSRPPPLAVLLAVASTLVAVLAGLGVQFPSVASLGALLVVGTASARPWRWTTLAKVAVAVGFIALDPRWPWLPVPARFAGAAVSFLMIAAAVLAVAANPRLGPGLDAEHWGETSAEFGRRIGPALGVRDVQAWFPINDTFVDLSGSPGTPGAPSITLHDSAGGVIAVVVGPIALDPTIRKPLADLLAVAGRLARLRHDSRVRAEELAASQRRIVLASDEERRRIQSQLARTVLATLGSLDSSVNALRQPGRLPEQLAETRAALSRFATGLDPLSDRTLSEALETLGHLPQVTANVAVPTSPDGLIARTVWFVAAEAVTNALKHAHGAPIQLEVVAEASMLTVRVNDQGPGGAPVHGLLGLRDRVRAVGGVLTVVSERSGTTIAAELPLRDTGLPVPNSRAIHDSPTQVPSLGSMP